MCSGHLANVKSPGLVYPGYVGSGIGNSCFYDTSGSEYKLINPPLDGSLASPDVTYPHGISYTSVDNIVLGQNNYGHIFIDGIRITSNLSDLTINALAPEPKYPPTNLTFTNVSTNGLTVNYAAEGFVNGVAVADMTFPAGTTYLAVINANGVVSFAHGGLAPNTPYNYAIIPFNWDGVNADTRNYHINGAIKTTSSYTLTNAPNVLNADTATQSSFIAHWNQVSGATGYAIDVSYDNFSTYLPGYNNFMLVDSTRMITGLNPGTTYQYQVRAVNSAGASTNSNIISVLTIPAAPTANTAAFDFNH